MNAIIEFIKIMLAVFGAFFTGVFLVYLYCRIITYTPPKPEQDTAKSNETWSSIAARACEIQTANSKGAAPVSVGYIANERKIDEFLEGLLKK